uniref:Zinc finger and BTB domain containing 6 n=1 Tax=Gadus morhua TaxID=8049 RepID=A0A8C4ZMH4_GADMO
GAQGGAVHSCVIKRAFLTAFFAIFTLMNSLRQERRFCDVTLILGGPGGPAAPPPLRFHGHRVVLAASSDFLRDKFLLHEGRSELCVGVVPHVEVGRRLLLSCYTGLLEVPLRELVSYLTTASALQMGQVVDRCAQASERIPGECEDPRHHPLPVTHSPYQEDRPPHQPTTSALPDWEETSMENAGGAEVKSEPRAERGAKVEFQEEVKAVRQEGGEGPRAEEEEEEEMYMLATRFKRADDLAESRWLSRFGGAGLAGGDFPGTELARDVGSLAQRPYLCRRCDRVFQHLDGYVTHLKEHRQYLCLLCGKSFSQKSNLTRHIRVHTGIKPFRCPLCHKTFSQKATLQDHLNLHTGDKPHKCNYCAVHFAHKPGLRRHLKDIHGKSSLQNVLEEIVD